MRTCGWALKTITYVGGDVEVVQFSYCDDSSHCDCG